MPADPPARLRISTLPVPKSGTALRVEVRDGDIAVNPNGTPVSGGWRAEAVGPQDGCFGCEHECERWVECDWLIAVL
jgi:hypothetical protein